MTSQKYVNILHLTWESPRLYPFVAVQATDEGGRY